MSARPRFDVSAYDPRNHEPMCSYQVDQYPWECDCGTSWRPAVREAFDRWVALHGEPVPLLLQRLTGPYGRADL